MCRPCAEPLERDSRTTGAYGSTLLDPLGLRCLGRRVVGDLCVSESDPEAEGALEPVVGVKASELRLMREHRLLRE